MPTIWCTWIYGWRDTPPGILTDTYMWDQFLDQPWIRTTNSGLPTVIYLKRGKHPGLPTEQRLELLQYWDGRLTAPSGEGNLRSEVLLALWHDWRRLETSRPVSRVRRPFGLAMRHAGFTTWRGDPGPRRPQWLRRGDG